MGVTPRLRRIRCHRARRRFGSSLNLNVHLYVAVVDGVFSRDRGELAFTPAAPPTRAEMNAIVRKVRKCIERVASSDGTELPPPLGACARIALARRYRSPDSSNYRTADRSSSWRD